MTRHLEYLSKCPDEVESWPTKTTKEQQNMLKKKRIEDSEESGNHTLLKLKHDLKMVNNGEHLDYPINDNKFIHEKSLAEEEKTQSQRKHPEYPGEKKDFESEKEFRLEHDTDTAYTDILACLDVTEEDNLSICYDGLAEFDDARSIEHNWLSLINESGNYLNMPNELNESLLDNQLRSCEDDNGLNINIDHQDCSFETTSLNDVFNPSLEEVARNTTPIREKELSGKDVSFPDESDSDCPCHGFQGIVDGPELPELKLKPEYSSGLQSSGRQNTGGSQSQSGKKSNERSGGQSQGDGFSSTPSSNCSSGNCTRGACGHGAGDGKGDDEEEERKKKGIVGLHTPGDYCDQEEEREDERADDEASSTDLDQQLFKESNSSVSNGSASTNTGISMAGHNVLSASLAQIPSESQDERVVTDTSSGEIVSYVGSRNAIPENQTNPVPDMLHSTTLTENGPEKSIIQEETDGNGTDEAQHEERGAVGWDFSFCRQNTNTNSNYYNMSMRDCIKFKGQGPLSPMGGAMTVDLRTREVSDLRVGNRRSIVGPESDAFIPRKPPEPPEQLFRLKLKTVAPPGTQRLQAETTHILHTLSDSPKEEDEEEESTPLKEEKEEEE